MPWQLNKEGNAERLNNVLYNLLNAIYMGTILLNPFLTQCTEKVLSVFNQETLNINQINKFDILKSGTVLGELLPLFPRLDIPAELEKLEQIANN